MRGRGPISFLRKTILDSRPKILNDLLEREGDQIITEIEVCRTPIRSFITKTLNFLSLGQFAREMKRRGFDTMFHLYLVLHLANGKTYSLEKNQRVNVIPRKIPGECRDMKYGKKTLRDFMETPEKLKIPGYYRYDAFRDNCQKWVDDILRANGIVKFNRFVLQTDPEKLVPGYLRTVARVFTDVAGVADFIFRGGELIN